jgi:hypothetical protein
LFKNNGGKLAFSERWIFGRIFVKIQGFRFGVLKYYTAATSTVFPEALGIVVCILAFTPYLTVLYTVQYNTKQLKTSSGQK